MSDRCLKCHNVLPQNHQLICPDCFSRVPIGLRLEWRNTRDEKGRRRVIAKVKKYIQSQLAIEARDAGLEEDFALGQQRIAEAANG